MTPEYATSRKVHAEIARCLKPTLIELGWYKRPGSSCEFALPVTGTDEQWLLWIQVAQWGNSDLGNDFTLNLERQTDLNVHPGSGPDSRILRRLNTEDRDLALSIESRIVSRKPRPGADRPIHDFMRQDTTGQLRLAWQRAFAPQPQRWAHDADPWLTYYSVADVSEWGAFLQERLAKLLQQTASAA